MTLLGMQVTDLVEQHSAAVSGVVPMGELTGFFDTAYSRVFAAIGAQGIVPAGEPYAFYRAIPTDVCDLDAGIPVASPIEEDGDVHPTVLPGGRAATGIHAGSYEDLGESWGELMAWAGRQGVVPAGPFWEVYLTDPRPGVDPAELRTQLVVPLRG